MTIATWPNGVRYPVFNGFIEQSGDNRSRHVANEGVPRVRRNASLAGDVASFTVVATQVERGRFDRWWREDLNRGAIAFVMENPAFHGAVLLDENGAVLLDENGAELLDSDYWLCLIGDQAPRYQRSGVVWDIEFSVVILPS